MADTGWRVTMVYSDGDTYSIVRSPWIMSFDATWEIAKRIQADAMEFKEQWPDFVGVGIEFVDGEKRL